MHYVITGAGQIGTQLAHDLLSDGHEVTIVRRSDRVPDGAHLLRGDAGDPELLARAVRGDQAGGTPATAIFHCIHSSYDSRAWRRDLPQREATVMDVAAQAGIPVVFPESVYAFGRGARDLAEGAELAPASPLGQMRAELLATRATHRSTTLSVVAADLVGPTATAQSSVFRQLVILPAASGKSPWVMGDPDAARSVTYIPDLTRAMQAAADHAAVLAPEGDAVLLSPSTAPLSQRDMAITAADALGLARPTVHSIPWPVLGLAGLFSPMLREMHRQRYLWDSPAVLREGRLATEPGLRPASWNEVLRSELAELTTNGSGAVHETLHRQNG
jgi:nucleoside-diphosphate-sugar epimerase